MTEPRPDMDGLPRLVSYWPHWSAFSESGVMGDPTVATAEKGAAFLDQASDEVARFIDEVARRPHAPGRDHHPIPEEE
jgi:creatinine amidohydrolase/Fe(II)-dependent formamide hydrolase-like protein